MLAGQLAAGLIDLWHGASSIRSVRRVLGLTAKIGIPWLSRVWRRPRSLTPKSSCVTSLTCFLAFLISYRKSVGIDKKSTIRPIVRKAVLYSESAGPVCYLVSIGAVAIWVAGVFFGVGFYFLTHNKSAGPLSGIASDHLSESLPETPRVSQSMISLDRLFISQPKGRIWRCGRGCCPVMRRVQATETDKRCARRSSSRSKKVAQSSVAAFS